MERHEEKCGTFRDSMSSTEGENKKWEEPGKTDLEIGFQAGKTSALEYLPFPTCRFSLYWITMPKILPTKN